MSSEFIVWHPVLWIVLDKWTKLSPITSIALMRVWWIVGDCQGRETFSDYKRAAICTYIGLSDLRQSRFIKQLNVLMKLTDFCFSNIAILHHQKMYFSTSIILVRYMARRDQQTWLTVLEILQLLGDTWELSVVVLISRDDIGEIQSKVFVDRWLAFRSVEIFTLWITYKIKP